MAFMPPITDESRKNYNLLRDFIRKVSYKPGWTLAITEDKNDNAFHVTVGYESYESENDACIPMTAESDRIRAARVAARLLGKSTRKPELRHFSRRFHMWDLDRMAPEMVIRYVIVETIKQAEMHEFDRWFKVDGFTVSES